MGPLAVNVEDFGINRVFEQIIRDFGGFFSRDFEWVFNVLRFFKGFGRVFNYFLG